MKLWLETIINCFKNEHNSIKQFLYFLKCFEPVTEKEINEFLSELNKSVYTKSVKEVVFNSDKRIISESSPDDVNGRNKQNIIMAYKFFHFIYSNVASGYLENIVSDKNLLNSIKEILSHNLFVPSDRVEIVFNKIKNGLNKNIRVALYDIIPQLEYGFKEYLRSKRIYPAVNAGSKRKQADLNHFLTMERFITPIKEILGEDLTKELQYLLVDQTYGNIRNRNYHMAFEDEAVATYLEIVAFFKIINVYCLGYDRELNIS